MTHSRHAAMKVARPCFVTCRVLGQTPLFSRPEPTQKVLDLWRGMQEKGRLTIYAFVLLEDYLDLMASADDLAREIDEFKGAAAGEILALLDALNLSSLLRHLKRFQDPKRPDTASQLWEPGAPPAMLHGHEAMQAKLEAIHTAPVRRGYVTEAANYRYSSARCYAGQPGLIPVSTDW